MIQRRAPIGGALTLLLGVSIVCPAVYGDGAQSSSTPGSMEMLERADTAFLRAFSERDLWAMGEVWANTDHASAIHPAHPVAYVNWDNVRNSWKQTFGHNRNVRIQRRAGAAHIAGDVAWVVDATRFEAVQTQTGQPVLMRNVIGTKIFEQHGDDWRLVHYHAHLPGLDTRKQAAEGLTRQRTISNRPPETLRQANAAFAQALSSDELAIMSRAWAKTDYVSAIHPGYPAPFLGWEDVRTSWKRTFEYSSDIEIRTLWEHWNVAGDIAWVVEAARFEGRQVDSLQPIRLFNLLVTKIFERAGGVWLLVHFHAHRGASRGG
ncbi:MAG: nuclear transport factor 2 family protein [Gammaproteobacteria bacterium]